MLLFSSGIKGTKQNVCVSKHVTWGCTDVHAKNRQMNCVTARRGGSWVLVWGSTWAGASVKSQGLLPTDSSKTSAVGTSNEPSTTFSIPNNSQSYLNGLLYEHISTVLYIHCACVYGTLWTYLRWAYLMFSANTSLYNFFKISAAVPNFPLQNLIPVIFFFYPGYLRLHD